MNKEFIRFPLKINLERNKEIDEAVHKINMGSYVKISKHQFILNAIDEIIRKQKGEPK